MLLPKDINPANTVYYNGALTLRVINSAKSNEFDFLEIYEILRLSNQLSFQAFLFALDWLFLVGSIKLNTNGEIEKCF